MLKAKTFVKEVPRNSGLGGIYSYRYGGKKDKKVSDPSVAMNDPFFKEELEPKAEVKRVGFRPIPEEDKDPIMAPKKPSGLSYPKVRVISGSGTKNIPNKPLSEAKTPWLDKKPKAKGTSGSFAIKGDYGFGVPQLETSVKPETEYRNPFPRPQEDVPFDFNKDILDKTPNFQYGDRRKLGLKPRSKWYHKKSNVQAVGAVAGVTLGALGLAGAGLLSRPPYRPQEPLLEFKPQTNAPKEISFKPLQKGKNLPPPPKSGSNVIEMPYNQPARAANASANSVKGSGETILLKAPKPPKHITPKSPRNLSDVMRNVRKKQNSQKLGKYDGKIVKTPPSVLRRFLEKRK